MTDSLLRVYHRMPSSLRTVAASIHGYYLKSWRYGAETEDIIESANELEYLPEHEIKSRSQERLAYILHRAATRVPFYRDYWQRRRKRGDKSSYEILNNWPILNKESVQANPYALIADDCNPGRMYRDHTSGTTGKPLSLWFSRETVRTWYAIFEARARHWYNTTSNKPWAILGGQPVISANTTKPPFWVWNAPMNQLYLSANHLSLNNTPSYLKALDQYSITHLITYSSSAALLARMANEIGLHSNRLVTIITNAEPLYGWQRDVIGQTFNCPIRETYGMAELAAAASECQKGNLHLWPEIGIIERLKDSENIPAYDFETGRMICTSLLNADMPLIRYEVGDRLAPPPRDSSCDCGRNLPVIGSIEGRISDMLIAPDGRNVYWLNPIFYDLPIFEAQIVQKEFSSVVIRYVASATSSVDLQQTMIDRIRNRMGDISITFESVKEIPRDVNGKFRPVIQQGNRQ